MSKKLGAAVFAVMACVLGPVTASAEDNEGALIEVTGTGETSTHNCTQGSVVDITGASNTVTLTGDCKSVTVSGSSNTVKIEGVRAIDVTGTANNVTWKRGAGKSKPKISRTGVNNKVTQEK
ncbi:DUF3060 domain-containing protein [Pyxidicoccus fallax]|uniref:DUF3060 domain-containing protein n=1 Tax=Pyxidicoccus fallax TaxID=394095 RepID=A0A848LLM2_9BACT|nr:DUF3060 domain-containing protein [Pyxidicoccus fallax]NMO18611.1 DUF3060 domain-containing protein [Pyxidicoccus fallax]NPC79152.1 DUF3060 domain-containing protein [Pyxidicoccus fallax]